MTPHREPRPHTHAGAILLLILAATLWSLGGLLIKAVSWQAPAISATRSIIAALTIVLWYRGRLNFHFSRWQIAGAVSYAGTVILFVLSNKLTTAANAILLQYTAPIYIALAAPWLLGERSRVSDWLVIVITLGGMALFFLDQLSTEGLWGNVAAIASGVFFAGLALFLRKQKDGSAIESVVLGNIIAAIAGLPFMLHGPYPDPTGWTALAVLGVFQLGVSYVAYAAATRRATAMDATFVLMLEPILNPIWVALFLGELPGRWAVVGGCIVLAAITVRAVLAARQRQSAESAKGTSPAGPAAIRRAMSPSK